MYNEDKIRREQKNRVIYKINMYSFFCSPYGSRYHQRSVGHMVQENTKDVEANIGIKLDVTFGNSELF